jgi:hypothetical protein
MQLPKKSERWQKIARPRWDSNPQSPAPEASALSIRPRGQAAAVWTYYIIKSLSISWASLRKNQGPRSLLSGRIAAGGDSRLSPLAAGHAHTEFTSCQQGKHDSIWYCRLRGDLVSTDKARSTLSVPGDLRLTPFLPPCRRPCREPYPVVRCLRS